MKIISTLASFSLLSQIAFSAESHFRSPDVTVVKVEEMYSINSDGGHWIDRSRCEKLNSEYADCTQKFEELTGVPSKETIRVAYGSSDAFICRAVKITTASRESALAVADGIGFFSFGWGEGKFIPADKLKSKGSAHFLNGETAVLNEFSGVAYCWLGSASSSSQAIYTFRPYMRFTDGQNVQFNWDQVEKDYLLKASVHGFDRTKEVLQ